MSDEQCSPAPQTLADRALARLRQLADGNGLAPEAITVVGAEEAVYKLEGSLRLEPIAETTGAQYPGAPRGRNQTMVADAGALRAEVERRTREFQGGAGWIPEVMEQLKAQPNEGWGLDDVKIDLPARAAALAASIACPTCLGQKTTPCTECRGNGGIVCAQCHGNKQEFCYSCGGRGVNPLHPEQQCVICHGQRYILCRQCNGVGQMTCPMCRGQRGIVCAACKGAGQFTEEATMSFGAKTHFAIKAEGPSGLRRGLDRVGLAKLGDGYADIKSVTPQEEPPVQQHSGMINPPTREGPKPELHYEAALPYADLRMDFAGHKALVGVFGKRAAMMGVPPFLDDALKPAREKLKRATKSGDLESALDARAMRDALALQVTGKGSVKELRRVYPLGLSPAAAQEILTNMRLALNRFTLRGRGLAAFSCVVASALIFGGIFLTPFHVKFTQGWPRYAVPAFDLFVLAFAIAAGWFSLGSSMRAALKKRFPDLAIPVQRNTGKTGIAMSFAIVALFIGVLMATPEKPVWFAQALKLVGL